MFVKFFIRAISLVLLPALLIDPAAASSISHLKTFSENATHHSRVNMGYFQKEAIPAHPLDWVGRSDGYVVRRSIGVWGSLQRLLSNPLRNFKQAVYLAAYPLILMLPAVLAAQVAFVYHETYPDCAISIVDYKTAKELKSIAIPTGWKIPFMSMGNFAMSNSGRRLYLTANHGLNVVDPDAGLLLRQITIPNVTSVEVSADDQTIYVGIGYGFVQMMNSSDLDKGINKPSGYIIPDNYRAGIQPAPQDPKMKISRDGRRLYVLNFFPDSSLPRILTVIDTANNSVVAKIPVTGFGYYTQILVSQDGNRVYLVSASGITTIDAISNKVISIDTQTNGAGAALSADGKRIYLSNIKPDRLVAVNTTPDPTNDSPIVFSLATPPNGAGMGFVSKVATTPDGQKVLMIDGVGKGFTHIFDLATNTALSVSFGPLGNYTAVWDVFVRSPKPATVSIDLPSTTLSAGQSQRFTASVGNVDNKGVIWSMTGPGSIVVSLDGLSAVYTAPPDVNSQDTAKITATSVADPTRSTSATVTLVPPTIDFTANGILNAASGLPGAIASGELVTIMGRGFGPQEGVTATPDDSGAYPTELKGVQVFIDDVPVPVLYTIKGQVNVILPDMSDKVGKKVKIRIGYKDPSSNSTNLSNSVEVAVAPDAPGIFTLESLGGGAFVDNEDGRLNSPSNPAAPGSLFSFLVTGIAQAQTISVTVNGQPAEVQSYEPLQGSIGLNKVIARLPDGASPIDENGNPVAGQVPFFLMADGVGCGQQVYLSISGPVVVTDPGNPVDPTNPIENKAAPLKGVFKLKAFLGERIRAHWNSLRTASSTGWGLAQTIPAWAFFGYLGMTGIGGIIRFRRNRRDSRDKISA